MKWTQVLHSSGPQPKPRHGHRAVAVGDVIIVIGGGNSGIVDSVSAYDTSQNKWFVPQLKGNVSPGRAAHGCVAYGSKILVFGGMMEYGRLSSDLYQLHVVNWKWKRLKPRSPKHAPSPCARLGHSFTLVGNKVYMFGGLCNVRDEHNPNSIVFTYLNDLYILELKRGGSSSWRLPQTYGTPPPPRESHTCIAYRDEVTGTSYLVIYGGMNGRRLNDLWFLNIDTMTWSEQMLEDNLPLPRSLHTATLLGHRMLIFGGLLPMLNGLDDPICNQKWAHSNSLAYLNLRTLCWEQVYTDVCEGDIPKPRYGHCAVSLRNRLYVWSGRDSCNKSQKNSSYYEDLWYVEIELDSTTVLPDSSPAVFSEEVNWKRPRIVRKKGRKTQTKIRKVEQRQKKRHETRAIEVYEKGIGNSGNVASPAKVTMSGHCMVKDADVYACRSALERPRSPEDGFLIPPAAFYKSLEQTACARKRNLHDSGVFKARRVNYLKHANANGHCRKGHTVQQSVPKERMCNEVSGSPHSFRVDQASLPEAPSVFTMYDMGEGALLTWETPPELQRIVEYTVYIAIDNTIYQNQTGKCVIHSNAGQLVFVRVYRGPENQCMIPIGYFCNAYIDRKGEPAIIFAVAACNDTGYGTASVVRCLIGMCV